MVLVHRDGLDVPGGVLTSVMAQSAADHRRVRQQNAALDDHDVHSVHAVKPVVRAEVGAEGRPNHGLGAGQSVDAHGTRLGNIDLEHDVQNASR